MDNNIFHLAIELVIGFFALLFMTKLLGKTQITQLTPFDFISALVLGELVGNAIYDKDIGIFYVLLAVIIWGLLIFFVEILTQKFLRARTFFEGKPSIVIQKGKIDYKMLKKNHMDINQLQLLLRQKDAFSIREIEYAILEANGTVSILKKSEYANPQNQDLKVPEKTVYLPVTFILDGEIIAENLKNAGRDEIWLRKELKKQGIDKIEDILFAEWLEEDSLYVNTY
ncbi:MAG TPA: DUF421 domain-containing protein [Bacilli bacterium]|nr:DUF421 domain-containing protein [Bacilli bacterium]